MVVPAVEAGHVGQDDVSVERLRRPDPVVAAVRAAAEAVLEAVVEDVSVLALGLMAAKLWV